MCTYPKHIVWTKFMELDSFIQLEFQSTRPYKFGLDWRLSFAVPVASMNGMIVSIQIQLIHGIEWHLAPISIRLKKQTISKMTRHIFLQTMITYRISYKQVQKSKLVVPKSLQAFTAFTLNEILFMLHARPFLINVLLTLPISFHRSYICSGCPKK